jgi:hypothetical protein
MGIGGGSGALTHCFYPVKLLTGSVLGEPMKRLTVLMIILDHPNSLGAYFPFSEPTTVYDSAMIAAYSSVSQGFLRSRKMVCQACLRAAVLFTCDFHLLGNIKF